MFRTTILLAGFCLQIVTAFAQGYELISLTADVKASFRGLAVVDSNLIWISGSNGYIGKSTDGGKHWEWMQPKGYEKLDFRDIQAFDANHAIIVNAGAPAYILSTKDGGKTWMENYKNTDSAVFLDGMDFWDAQNGIVFGDPLHQQMQLLKTSDGGTTWEDITQKANIVLQIGEAGFAASGTSIKTGPKGKVWIASGGSAANIYSSSNYGATWKKYRCPIQQGESSTGIFSLDFFDDKNGIAVGGNYLKDKEANNNMLYTTNGGKKWKKPKIGVKGYRSGVTYIDRKTCIATGTSGTDISTDGGRTWQNISPLGFNVVKAAGNFVLLAGTKGQIYQLSGIR